MLKLRSYISVFFLALLLFPVAEKVQHEWRHLSQDHCDSTGLHFCESKHHCDICDYIFSSSVAPPASPQHPVVFSSGTSTYACHLVPEGLTFNIFHLYLRGPPATA